MTPLIKDDFDERGRRAPKEPASQNTMKIQDTWESDHITLYGQPNPAKHRLVVEGNVIVETPDGWLLTNIDMDVLNQNGRMIGLNDEVKKQTKMTPKLAERILPYPFMCTTQLVLNGLRTMFFPRGEFTDQKPE